MIFVALAVAGAGFASAQTEDGPSFPVTPEIFVDEPFTSAEGITFNAEGRMFVSANKAVWEVGLDRSARKLFDTDSNLGLAAYGERDILVADFGPTNAFQDDRNSDGVVWRSTPEGERVAFATGIGDPNAIVVRDDGSRNLNVLKPTRDTRTQGRWCAGLRDSATSLVGRAFVSKHPATSR